MNPGNLPSRVFNKIDFEPNTGCWLWNAATREGYGCLKKDPPAKGMISAHRYLYALSKGPIQAGLEIDHLCRQRLCCNPDHLEAVSHRQNLLRSPLTIASKNSRKTRCPAGHPYSSTRQREDGVERICLVCQRRNDSKILAGD